MSSPSILILDFQDSFTYNVACEIYPFFPLVQVIHFHAIFSTLEQLVEKKHLEKTVLIYGPGPGHPDDYAFLYPVIKKLLDRPMIFHMGICLGHQLLWLLKGFEIKKRKSPRHGVQISLLFPQWFTCSQITPQKVQTYNSLTVEIAEDKKWMIRKKNHLYSEYQSTHTQEDLWFFKDECWMGRFSQGITYQFHPESLATEENEVFFRPLKTFLGLDFSKGDFRAQ
jgi:anthranilate/para-aminobenzoate synthase component II